MSKTKTGIVISNKANKTAIVRVDRMVPHAKYGKRYRVSSKFAAHDEANTAQIGDTVIIKEVAPMSKTKTWVIVEGTTGTATVVTEAPVKEVTKKPRAKKTVRKAGK